MRFGLDPCVVEIVSYGFGIGIAANQMHKSRILSLRGFIFLCYARGYDYAAVFFKPSRTNVKAEREIYRRGPTLVEPVDPLHADLAGPSAICWLRCKSKRLVLKKQCLRSGRADGILSVLPLCL